MYRTMGRLHAGLHQLTLAPRSRLAAQEGQGTIEYVGLIMLLSVVMAAVIAAAKGDFGLTEVITDKVKGAIEGATKGK